MCLRLATPILLPDNFASESLTIFYYLYGNFGAIGGQVEPESNLHSYAVSTTYSGQPAERIKALLFAPGCALQTLDLTLTGVPDHIPANQFRFTCLPEPNVAMEGTVSRLDRLYGRPVEIHATYVASWARDFFGIGDGVTPTIPLAGSAPLDADGHFLLIIPDLSRDPLAGAPDHAGTLELWARDKENGVPVALLTPNSPGAMRMGHLKIQAHYQPSAFTICSAIQPTHPYRQGFAMRPDSNDGCDR